MTDDLKEDRMDGKLRDHGGSAPIPLEAAVADDPDLWLVFGDPVA